MGKEIFRKVSLERLSSPEQLDVLMKVTSPLGWLSLLSAGLLLVAALFWGFFGSIATTVTGNGILVKTGGVLDIESPAGGQVTAIYVDGGDVVSKGQLLARLAQPKLLSEINTLKAQLRELNEEYETIANFDAKNLKERLGHYAKQRDDLQDSIQSSQEQLNWQNAKLVKMEKLLGEGLVGKQDYHSTQTDVMNLTESIERKKSDLEQLAIDEAEFRQKQELELLGKKQQIDKLRIQIKTRENDVELKSRVTSPYTGSVVEVIAIEGAWVNDGDKLLTLELAGEAVKDLVAALYVSAADGKKIKPGMKVNISPSTVKKEEWGSMLGIVTSVSAFPATEKGILRNLQNKKLVDSFSAGGAPIEINADLIPDPHASSLYKWSSLKGPPISIEHGTLCSATIAVEEQPPISLVIPLFKKHVIGIGLSQ